MVSSAGKRGRPSGGVLSGMERVAHREASTGERRAAVATAAPAAPTPLVAGQEEKSERDEVHEVAVADRPRAPVPVVGNHEQVAEPRHDERGEASQPCLALGPRGGTAGWPRPHREVREHAPKRPTQKVPRFRRKDRRSSPAAAAARHARLLVVVAAGDEGAEVVVVIHTPADSKSRRGRRVAVVEGLPLAPLVVGLARGEPCEAEEAGHHERDHGPAPERLPGPRRPGPPREKGSSRREGQGEVGGFE